MEPQAFDDAICYNKASSPSGAAQARGAGSVAIEGGGDVAHYEEGANSKPSFNYSEFLNSALFQQPSAFRRGCAGLGLSARGSKRELAQRLACHWASTA